MGANRRGLGRWHVRNVFALGTALLFAGLLASGGTVAILLFMHLDGRPEVNVELVMGVLGLPHDFPGDADPMLNMLRIGYVSLAIGPLLRWLGVRLAGAD